MTVRLTTLVKRHLGVDPEITGVTADSRRVKPGFLFAALPGVTADGATFAAKAGEYGGRWIDENFSKVKKSEDGDVKAERLSQETFVARNGVQTFPNIVFARESFNTLSGSMGVKVNLGGRVLFDANLLFALDDHGVRDRVTPLVAIEYGF